MSAHPTPWRVWLGSDVLDAKGREVCKCASRSAAELIVAAVNGREKMVKALKTLLESAKGWNCECTSSVTCSGCEAEQIIIGALYADKTAREALGKERP